MERPTRYHQFSIRKLAAFLLTVFAVSAMQPPPVSKAQTTGAAVPASFSSLSKKVSPSVVNLGVEKTVQTGARGGMPFQSPGPPGQGDPFHDFFRRYFGDQMPRQFKQQGLGSGFVIDKKGHILTNNHVVEGADKIEVTFKNDRVYAAEIVGRDPMTDLALIKIKPDHELVPLALGDSDQTEVGDWVIAVGSPFGLGDTVTAGIVSAKFRRIGGAYDDYIQTDASINPGNSGGPLVNDQGEAIGVNTAIFSRSGGNIGIGFAVPINIAKQLLPQLKKGEVVRGWLGVGIQEITEELKQSLDLKTNDGVLVSGISAGSPADKAGIRRGDVIVSFDGNEVKEMHQLPFMVATTPVGKKVAVEILRDGSRKTLQVEIGRLREEGGEIASPEDDSAPRLGMNVQNVTPEIAQKFDLPASEGVVVLQVQPGSPAAQAGLAPGDILLEIGREKITDVRELKEKLKDYKEGDVILLLVNRRGQTIYITVKPSE